MEQNFSKILINFEPQIFSYFFSENLATLCFLDMESKIKLQIYLTGIIFSIFIYRVRSDISLGTYCEVIALALEEVWFPK